MSVEEARLSIDFKIVMSLEYAILGPCRIRRSLDAVKRKGCGSSSDQALSLFVYVSHLEAAMTKRLQVALSGRIMISQYTWANRNPKHRGVRQEW